MIFSERGNEMIMSLIWDKVSDWLTGIGIAFFGLGAVCLMASDGFAVGVGLGLVFFLLSVVLQVFGIAAEVEAMHCLDREEEYAEEDA